MWKLEILEPSLSFVSHLVDDLQKKLQKLSVQLDGHLSVTIRMFSYVNFRCTNATQVVFGWRILLHVSIINSDFLAIKLLCLFQKEKT